MNSVTEGTSFKIISHFSLEKEHSFLESILDNSNNKNEAIKKCDISNKNDTYSGHYKKEIKSFFDAPPIIEESKIVTSSFQPLQEWEGYIQEINEPEQTFTATLLDLTGGMNYPSEEGDFPLNMVSKFDTHFLRIGAIFRWIIGYELKRKCKNRQISITRTHSSYLVFRRIPRWTESSLNKAKIKAKEFKDEIIWE